MGSTTLTWGVLLTAFTFGLRHGADWDHIAAIADLTGTTKDRRRSMMLALLYALGHALVVLVLGSVAIYFGQKIPASVDDFMSRVVGVTLLLLGGFLLLSLIREGRGFRYRSRLTMVMELLRRARSRWMRPETVEVEHEHPHDHGSGAGHSHEHADLGPEKHTSAVATKHTHKHVHLGTRPSEDYGTGAAFVIGMLHGVGAETPTQVVLFLTAAGVGGRLAGSAVLGMFILGLLVTNTLVAAITAAGFLQAEKNFGLYAAIGVAAALFSLVLGSILLFDPVFWR